MSSVDVVPCDVPHVYELVDVVALQHPSDADFPGADALFEYGSQGCAEDFKEIVGTPLPQSVLEIVLITPLGEGWDEGDREILCVAVRDDGTAAGTDGSREWAVTARPDRVDRSACPRWHGTDTPASSF